MPNWTLKVKLGHWINWSNLWEWRRLDNGTGTLVANLCIHSVEDWCVAAISSRETIATVSCGQLMVACGAQSPCADDAQTGAHVTFVTRRGTGEGWSGHRDE